MLASRYGSTSVGVVTLPHADPGLLPPEQSFIFAVQYVGLGAYQCQY